MRCCDTKQDICSINSWHYEFVPNQPKTPVKGFRIPVDLYDAALAKAQREGRTLTEIVREALQRYVDSEDSTAPR